MSEQQFKIVFEGRVAEGVSPDQARDNIRTLFSLSDARLEHLFSGQPVVMKSGLDAGAADNYLNRMQRAGIVATRVAMRAPAPAAPPTPPVPPVKPTGSAGSGREDDEPRIAGFRFNGNGKEYFGIWIVNILLTIVTLGIYSAWAKVRNLQYFYGNTELDVASFQFLARPTTILKGRLIALAALILYSAAFAFFPVIGLLLMVLLVIGTPWIIVRSLRFHAINTAYRNVRFDFEGRYLDALMLTLIWPVLNALCLFLLTPLIARKGHQFLVEGSRYGTTPFQWHGATGTYYRFFGIGLLIAIGVIVAAIVLSMINPVIGPIIGAVGYLGLFGYFKAGLANLMINHAELADHQLTSELEPVRLAWIFVSNSFLTVITLGLYLPWAKVRLARYRADCTSMAIQGDLDHFVAAESRRTSALGEELGEAFDVGFAAI
ncbi:YjgN family protein [Marinobacter segnicrescens]|uniref:YjgN family protein n=1 Tax=Marinobacter segnicrescens TaxID=430453 RepID=UPI003A928E91